MSLVARLVDVISKTKIEKQVVRDIEVILYKDGVVILPNARCLALNREPPGVDLSEQQARKSIAGFHIARGCGCLKLSEVKASRVPTFIFIRELVFTEINPGIEGVTPEYSCVGVSDFKRTYWLNRVVVIAKAVISGNKGAGK